MNADMEDTRIKITDIPTYVFESITRDLGYYSTGLVLLKKSKASVEVSLIGSGTLIKIEQVYGILTVQHVTQLHKDGTELGLVMAATEHRLVLHRKNYDIIDVAKASKPSKGPDLSVIILFPSSFLATLEARKSFYDLSRKREEILRKPLDNDLGVWMLCGFPDELTTVEESTRGHESVRGFRGICGAIKVENDYERRGYDFLELSVSYGRDIRPPSTFGGVSGGGLWQVRLIRSKEGDIQPLEHILSGVAFYETEIKDGIRYVRCHGRRSIYQSVYGTVKRHFLQH